MTIYYRHGEDFPAPNTEVVNLGTVANHRRADCFTQWWRSSARVRGGWISLLCGDRLSDGQTITVLAYAEWLRSFGYHIRTVRYTVDSDGFSVQSADNTAFELSFRTHSSSEYIYTGMCLMRFLSPEFISPIPANLGPRELMQAIFIEKPEYVHAHMPFINNPLVKFDEMTGLELYDFFTEVLPARQWNDKFIMGQMDKNPIATYKEYLSSGISDREYKGWLSSHAILDTANELKEQDNA